MWAVEQREEQQITQNAHTHTANKQTNKTQTTTNNKQQTTNNKQGRLYLRELRDMLRPEQAPLLLLIVVMAVIAVRVCLFVCVCLCVRRAGRERTGLPPHSANHNNRKTTNQNLILHHILNTKSNQNKAPFNSALTVEVTPTVAGYGGFQDVEVANCLGAVVDPNGAFLSLILAATVRVCVFVWLLVLFVCCCS